MKPLPIPRSVVDAVALALAASRGDDFDDYSAMSKSSSRADARGLIRAYHRAVADHAWKTMKGRADWWWDRGMVMRSKEQARKGWCSECSRQLRARACGPTHAAMRAEQVQRAKAKKARRS